MAELLLGQSTSYPADLPTALELLWGFEELEELLTHNGKRRLANYYT